MTRSIRFRGRIAAALVAGSFALAAAPAATANDTVALKNALYGAGYAISNVSPQMDNTTRSALEQFQSDNGLTASGTLDQPTKEALGMVSVQVAVSAGSNSGGQSAQAASPSSAAAEPQQTADDDIEEDDDGGWSFF
jgi:peptidoglycan hydrolase-like protein with peptidoglycan-binding domain